LTGRLRPARLALALTTSLALAPAAPGATLFAGRIDATNVDRVRPGGADAIGGIDDWALSNGTLCAVVSDPAHESDLAPRGGALVDLGRCGRGDDQLVLLQPLVNLAQSGWIAGERVRAESSPGEVRLVVEGERDGLVLETTFTLDAVDAARLRLRSRLVRRAPGARAFAFGDVALHGERAIRPFAVDLAGRRALQGFAHPPIDFTSLVSLAGATGRADAQVLVGADALEPGISYGLRVVSARLERSDEAPVPLHTLALAAEPFTGFAVFTRPFWLGQPEALGLVTGAQTLWMDVEPGDTIVVERELRVGERSDVASALDPMIDSLVGESVAVRGRVFEPEARVHVHASDGRAITQARPDPDGGFRLRVPAAASRAEGAYRLDVLAPGGRELGTSFAVLKADLDLGDLVLPPAARLALPRGAPMRLVFLGEEGTDDPVFGDDLLGLRFGDDALPTSVEGREISLAGIEADPEAVTLAPGRYRVLATRGPEFGVSEARIVVEAGQTRALAIAPPERVLATPGWIAADLHVHAAPSDDSALPLRQRLASYVAQGDEVLVATDHDHVTDYGPLVRELGLASRIATVVGQEVTGNVATPEAPHTLGHANAFPLPYQPHAHRKGALANEGRRLRDVLAQVRALGGARVVQLNHPRPDGAPEDRLDPQALLTHLSVGETGFDPRLPLSEPPNAPLAEEDPVTGLRDVDFDAIELLNGPSLERYRRVRADWFALLRQSLPRTGTASSDSHRLAEPAAVPRSYVRLPQDDPAAFDEAAFVSALREGRVVGSTGPLVVATLGDVASAGEGAGVGERFTGGAARLRVEVKAAPWVPVDRIRVYVDGREVRSGALELVPGTGDEAGARVARASYALTFDGDAFVTVEVEGDPAASELYRALLPRFTPFAFTNPIYVDANADGRWEGPGL
jgi:hypothetical protein